VSNQAAEVGSRSHEHEGSEGQHKYSSGEPIWNWSAAPKKENECEQRRGSRKKDAAKGDLSASSYRSMEASSTPSRFGSFAPLGL
jgi:hypothetical protein